MVRPYDSLEGDREGSVIKDFWLAGELATQCGVPTRLLDLCRLEVLEAMHRGWGDQDRTRSATLQEERAGVQLRLPEAAQSSPE